MNRFWISDEDKSLKTGSETEYYFVIETKEQATSTIKSH